MIKRCDWGNSPNQWYMDYHDKEWGTPLHDDQKIFELLILEGMQAGLSWSTIMAKRENFRKAFDNFDYNKVAKYNQKKIDELLTNAGIIRNKLKINAAILNAHAFLKIQSEFGSFDNYIWGFVNHKTIQNSWKTMREVPDITPLAEKISKELLKRGFKFVGPTIIYSFMQAIGLVNDHIVDCFRYKELRTK